MELTCPICLQLFSEPVSLPCGHIYCLGCLETMGEGLDHFSCPECQTEYTEKALVKNFKMCNIVETYKATASAVSDPSVGDHVTEDSDDGSPTGGSANLDDEEHNKSKINAEINEPKLKLAGQISELSLKLEVTKDLLRNAEEREREVVIANSKMREKVSTLLKLMMESLQTYSTRVMDLIEEELVPGEESLRLQVRQASELTSQLRETMASAESLLKEESVTEFKDKLQMLQPNIEKLAEPVEEDQGLIESQINPMKARPQLEALNADFRDRIGEIQRSLCNTFNPSEVTFDPETLHPNLLLSEDLKTVTYSAAKQSYPPSPKRFTSFFQVLSSQSFSKGEHCWQVDLEGSPWIVGVCYGAKLDRSGMASALEGSSSSWCLMWHNNLLTAFEQSRSVPLIRTTLPCRLEIRLSFKTQRLSFYNVSQVSGKTLVHTFTPDLTEPVYLAYRMMTGHPNARVTVY